MSEIELKACPMCGGSDLKIMGDAPLQAILGGYRVYCDAPSCQCQGRHSGNREKAIRAWNRRPPQWQPIESAPKDGTGILLSNGKDVAEGHWYFEEGGTTEHRDLDGRYIDQTDSDGYAGWLDWDGGMQPDPTHWMPLPAPPEVEG